MARKDAESQSLTNNLAPIGTVSFCSGVQNKRFSGKREIAPKKTYEENNTFAYTIPVDFVLQHRAQLPRF